MLSWIAQGIDNVINAITSGLTSVYNTIKDLNDAIGEWIIGLGESIGNFFSSLGDIIGDLGTNIGGWFSDLGSNLGNWLSYINPFSENFFGYKLIEMLQEALVYLFTPSDANIEELQSTINSKFGFIESIRIAVNNIQDMLENIENGTSEFTIDIDSEVYEGEVVLFDLAWYAPFKSYGDLVFTGFAYVLFVWRIWKAIPSILNGFSSVTSGISKGGGDE